MRCSRARSITASIGALLLLFTATAAGAAEITLKWQAPTTREDGTPLDPADIAGYKIHYGASSGSYDGQQALEGPSPLDLPISALSDPANPSTTLTGLTTCARYYFAATTYDTMGAESSLSAEAVKAALDAPVVSPPQPSGEGALSVRWSGLAVNDVGARQKVLVYYDLDRGEPYEGGGATQGDSPIQRAGGRLSLDLTGLLPETRYFLVVEAACPDGTTKRSEEVSGTSGGVDPPPADLGVDPPPPDSTMDSTTSDAGVVPSPRDAGALSGADAGTPEPGLDSGSPAIPARDGGASNGLKPSTLTGGCAIAAGPSFLPLLLIVVVSLLRRQARLLVVALLFLAVACGARSSAEGQANDQQAPRALPSCEEGQRQWEALIDEARRCTPASASCVVEASAHLESWEPTLLSSGNRAALDALEQLRSSFAFCERVWSCDYLEPLRALCVVDDAGGHCEVVEWQGAACAN